MPGKKLGRIAGALLFILFFSFSVSAQNNIGGVYLGNLAQPPVAFAPDRVIVKFAASVTDDEADQIVQKFKAKVKRKARKKAFQLLSVEKGKVWQTVHALRKNPRVAFAHPDWKAYATMVPEDPGYFLQWHLDNADPNSGGIHMETAWDLSAGGDPSVTVAVVDSGIAYEDFGVFRRAPDLAGTAFVLGWDFVNNDSHPNDDNSHGTHVAGTIAQSTNNGIGVAGIAYNVALMPVKVLGADGSGYISDIAEGIRWAADNGADIISMSFGTSAPAFYLTSLQNAVGYAHSQGVLLVGASGNNNGGSPVYPAAYPEVIAVGATLYDKRLATYSAVNNEVCAPGGTNQGEDLNGDGYADMILQNTFNPNTRDVDDFGYWFFSGTSMAAPHVSGLAALMISLNPELASEDVRQLLRDTADQTVDPACGFGLIDAAAALFAANPGDTPPQVNIVHPVNGAVVSGSVTVQIEATDRDDLPGTLTVELNISTGTEWHPVAYNDGNGYYEFDLNTTGYPENTVLTLVARATDSLFQIAESESIQVTVNNSNDAPVANFTYICNGSICDFDAAGSYDPDGSVVGYAWNFGDGAAASGITASHTFTERGTFTVKLTVSDDVGATGTTETVVVIDALTNTLHIADLDAYSFKIYGRFWGTIVTVFVADAAGSPVANATVSGVFSDGSTLFQCTTDGSGECDMPTGYQFWLKCLTFSVLDVSHDTLDYLAEENADPDGDSDGTEIVTCRP